MGQDLPQGVEALAAQVTGSPLLLRRLSQVGIVERARGVELQKQLLPGQRLVSREGDLWRWDGFASAADAPSAAATRLAQRNRMDELAAAREAAEAKANDTARALEEIETQYAALKERHEAERIAAQDAQNAASVGQQQLAQAEAGAATDQAKLQALDTSEARIRADMAELEAARKATDEALKALANEARDLEDMDGLRDDVADKRNLLAEARARFDGFYAQRQAREQQLARVKQDQASWQQRADAARDQVSALESRRGENLAEKEKFTAIPDALAERRAKLADVVRQAEARRQTAADELAEAETAQAAADKTLRASAKGKSPRRANSWRGLRQRKKPIMRDAKKPPRAFAKPCRSRRKKPPSLPALVRRMRCRKRRALRPSSKNCAANGKIWAG